MRMQRRKGRLLNGSVIGGLEFFLKFLIVE